jgi:hypothetical protein
MFPINNNSSRPHRPTTHADHTAHHRGEIEQTRVSFPGKSSGSASDSSPDWQGAYKPVLKGSIKSAQTKVGFYFCLIRLVFTFV